MVELANEAQRELAATPAVAPSVRDDAPAAQARSSEGPCAAHERGPTAATVRDRWSR